MKRIFRTLEYSARELHHTATERLEILKDVNSRLPRQWGKGGNLIITPRLESVAADFMAATGQRLYVRQIARGIYQQISDERGQPRPLGILLSAVLTAVASVWLVTLSFSLAAAAPVAISAFFPAVALVCLLVYAYVWLHVGAQAVQRIKSSAA